MTWRIAIGGEWEIGGGIIGDGKKNSCYSV